MVFWGALELVIALVLILIFITQVFIPLWNGTKLFPSIRRRKLDAELKEVKDNIEEEGVKSEIDKEVEKLKSLRKEREENEGVRQQQQTKTGSGNDQKGDQKGS